MDQMKLFTEQQKEFLEFLKTRYNLFHASNVFFRDLHYGVMTFLELHNEKHPSYQYTTWFLYYKELRSLYHH